MTTSGLLAVLKRSWLPLLVAIGLSIAAIATSGISRELDTAERAAHDDATRVSEAQQVSILRQVYPEFAGEQFPSGTIEAVKD